MNKLATILLCVNFITVLFPQPGFIHPDEFFQCSEITAGDILQVQHFRAWEFNTSFPVRSIVFPYLLTGPSLSLLKWMNGIGVQSLQISAVKIVMATRLPLAFLSIFGYLATSRLAEFCRAETYLSTVLWCSSYVTWTYFTRTFSNTIEAVLMAIILLLVFSSVSCLQTIADLRKKKHTVEKMGPKESFVEDSLAQSKETNAKGEKGTQVQLDRKKAKEEHAHRDVSETKEELFIEEEDLPLFQAKVMKMTSFLLGVLVVAGFFNRPTFLLFSAVPVLFWLSKCLETSNVLSVFINLVRLGFGSVVTFVIFVTMDTFYFFPTTVGLVSEYFQSAIENGFSISSLGTFVKSLAPNLVITPWNFIQYNMRSENLKEHGLHPHYTHLLVNMPLLLGPLVIPFVITCLTTLFSLLRGQYSQNSLLWLTSMALFPIFGLSVFPHQEPRFLVPLLPVLVVLGSKFISKISHAKLSFIALWIVFNIVLNLVYGYMHQAALIPALSIYQQKLSSGMRDYGSTHAVFYKTYPPPQHLLLLNKDQTKVTIHDLAGAPLNSLLGTVVDSKALCEKSKGKCAVYVFLPSTAAPPVLDALQRHNYKMSATSICPHLSMESPPRFSAWWKKRISFEEFAMDFCLNVIKIN